MKKRTVVQRIFSFFTLGKIQNFLDTFFTPFRVKWGGLVLSLVLAGLFLRGGERIGFVISMLIAAIDYVWPNQLWGWISNFADPPNWPPFVAVGVAIVFAAHAGHWQGALCVVGPLATYDGQYFDINY